jgi:multidrug transporter EmrE-like cation transporter
MPFFFGYRFTFFVLTIPHFSSKKKKKKKKKTKTNDTCVHFDGWGEKQWFLFATFLSGVASLSISYSSAWCVRVTSSTTYSMVGALNKLPVALLGMVFFGNAATLGGILSLFLGIASGVVYSQAKIQQQQESAKSILPVTTDTGHGK